MNREDTPTNARSPITVLTVVLVMTWAVLAGLGWSSYSSYHKTEAATQHRLRIEDLRGSIIHLDEVLTMSARMAAFTGDLQWEERYRHFKPQLDTAIKEAVALAPGAHSDQTAAETDAANIKLVEMENRAFDLVRQGRAEEAKAVLFSDEYESQKQVYAKGMDAFAAGLADIVGTALKREHRRYSLQTGAVLLLMPLLIVAWLVVFRAVHTWKTTLAKQAEELAEVNQSLDQRVVERTEALQNEVAERKRAEEEIRRLATIVEQTVEGVAVANLEGTIEFANQAWAAMHGYDSAEELLGEPLSIFHTEEQIKTEVIPFNEQVKQSGYKIGEMGHKRKDGSTFPTMMAVSLLKDEQGKPYGLAGFAQDITERKQAEEKLKKSMDEIERFNRLMVGREGRVIEMKKEVNSLLAELGKEPEYKSVLKETEAVSSDKAG